LPVGDNWTKDSENPFDGLIGTASWNEGGTADPWAIRPSFDRDTIYVFFEVFNSDESLRQIGVASASADSPFDLDYESYTNPVNFSDAATSTSFPFVFEHGGHPYMVRSSALYKTSRSDFPGGEWTKVWDFPIDMADLSLVQKNGVWIGVGSRNRTTASGNDYHVQQVVTGTELEDETTFQTHPQRYIPKHRNTPKTATKSGMLHKFGENLVMFYQYENGQSIGCATFDNVGAHNWALTRYDSPILGSQNTGVWDRNIHHLSVVRVDDTYYGYYDGKDPFGDDMWRVGGVTMGAVV
jgi:hypothetical protein